jgi:hypothetical protein
MSGVQGSAGVMLNINYALLGKTQDIVADQMQGIIEMADDVPKAAGYGDKLDVVA